MLWFNKKSTQLPVATGPFVPGCSDIMIGYEKDGLFVRLYYPTNAPKSAENNSKKRYHWIPADMSTVQGIANVIKVPYYILRLVFWWNGNPIVPVLSGEDVRVDDGMKCIIFSHGLGGYRAIYSKICYDLASHGYLVACLEHRDQSCLYTYYYTSKENAEKDERTVIEFDFGSLGQNHLDKRKKQIEERSAECVKAVEFFKKLNDGHVPKNVLEDLRNNQNNAFRLNSLVGKIDVDNFIIMGHSYGAATALLTLPKSPAIRHCIALDPWMFPIKDDNLHEKFNDTPLLIINTETFHIEANVKAMAKFLTNEKSEMYTLRQTTHEHQTDSALIVGSWLNLLIRKADPHEALKTNNALIMAFLSRYVGLPKQADEYQNYLERNKRYWEKGLTKAWQ